METTGQWSGDPQGGLQTTAVVLGVLSAAFFFYCKRAGDGRLARRLGHSPSFSRRFTGFCRGVPSFVRFDRVFLVFTEFDLVLLGFTEFYRVVLHSTGT